MSPPIFHKQHKGVSPLKCKIFCCFYCRSCVSNATQIANLLSLLCLRFDPISISPRSLPPEINNKKRINVGKQFFCAKARSCVTRACFPSRPLKRPVSTLSKTFCEFIVAKTFLLMTFLQLTTSGTADRRPNTKEENRVKCL